MGLSSGLPASIRGSSISGRIFDGLIISRSCSDYQPIKERNYDDFRKSGNSTVRNVRRNI